MEIKSKGIQVATIDLTKWQDGYEYARLLKMYPTFKILDISLDDETKTIEITFFGSREKVEKVVKKKEKKVKTATLPEEDDLYPEKPEPEEELPGIDTGEGEDPVGAENEEPSILEPIEEEEELEVEDSLPASDLGTVYEKVTDNEEDSGPALEK